MSHHDFPEVFSSRTARYGPSQVVRLPKPIPTILFVLSAFAGLALFSFFGGGLGVAMAAISLLAGVLLANTVKMASEWEKGLVFRLGRFHMQRGPGLFAIIPFIDSVKLIDTRIRTLEIPHKQAITMDNVPVRIDGVIFMRVEEPAAAVIRVQNFEEAVQEYAQTAVRDIVGSTSLDDLLTDREALGRKVEEMVEAEIDGWGIEVAGIRLQDIELPEDLKRVMARQASAEREKRATITKAQGDREAADNLAAAAEKMATSPGALQLRMLQTLDGLGPSNSNTVVLALPTEVFEAMKSIPQFAEAVTVKSKES